jgi:predicted 3-demethylubiquinone-9 3-methyltransferase (glyoxalase superfamily)
MAKNTICIWDAEAAAHFYAKTFPDREVTGKSVTVTELRPRALPLTNHPR